MLESVFVLFLAVALGVSGFAVFRRDPALLVLGAILFMSAGLLLLDPSSGVGIEQDNGFFVNSVGDDNFTIDFNTSFRNAGNDTSLLLLGNLFFWGGGLGLVSALGLLAFGQLGVGRK